MQQRRVASGRPLGTDGSDFSYRMVVESRYTKVAEGKSRLIYLILLQTLYHMIGLVVLFQTTSEAKEMNKFVVLSVSTGFLSLLVGELGRRHSKAVLLRLYTSLSSIAVAFSVACLIRSDFFLKVFQQNTAPITSYEIFDVGRLVFGAILQMLVIATTVVLLQNMSPPKRAA